MFEIKCVSCKFFNPYDLSCKAGEDEASCKSYQQNESDKASVAVCENCAFYDNGFCDYDLTNPKTCRRFKDKKEE